MVHVAVQSGCVGAIHTYAHSVENTHKRSPFPDSLDLILDTKRVDLEQETPNGFTPLNLACQTQDTEIIRRLVEAFRPVPTVVEVRHREFLFQPGPAGELATGRGTLLCFLEELGASLSNIDQPQGRDTIPPTSINTSPLAYVRLHGRNTRGWFRQGAGRDEKYDYLYSMAELREWKDRIQRLEKRAKRTVVIFNNHFRAQAPANALELLHLLGLPALDPPAELLGAFPNLTELASRG